MRSASDSQMLNRAVDAAALVGSVRKEGRKERSVMATRRTRSVDSESRESRGRPAPAARAPEGAVSSHKAITGSRTKAGASPAAKADTAAGVEEQARADAIALFRAAMRARMEMTSTQRETPDGVAASTLLIFTFNGESVNVASMLGRLAGPAVQRVFAVAPAAGMAYLPEFLAAYQAAALAFRSSPTVEDYLGEATPSEGPWREALRALATAVLADSPSTPPARLPAGAGKSGIDWRGVAFGLVVMSVGAGISSNSYQAASTGGGTYVILWGAVLWGGWMVLKGLLRYR